MPSRLPQLACYTQVKGHLRFASPSTEKKLEAVASSIKTLHFTFSAPPETVLPTRALNLISPNILKTTLRRAQPKNPFWGMCKAALRVRKYPKTPNSPKQVLCIDFRPQSGYYFYTWIFRDIPEKSILSRVIRLGSLPQGYAFEAMDLGAYW